MKFRTMLINLFNFQFPAYLMFMHNFISCIIYKIQCILYNAILYSTLIVIKKDEVRHEQVRTVTLINVPLISAHTKQWVFTGLSRFIIFYVRNNLKLVKVMTHHSFYEWFQKNTSRQVNYDTSFVRLIKIY